MEEFNLHLTGGARRLSAALANCSAHQFFLCSHFSRRPRRHRGQQPAGGRVRHARVPRGHSDGFAAVGPAVSQKRERRRPPLRARHAAAPRQAGLARRRRARKFDGRTNLVLRSARHRPCQNHVAPRGGHQRPVFTEHHHWPRRGGEGDVPCHRVRHFGCIRGEKNGNPLARYPLFDVCLLR